MELQPRQTDVLTVVQVSRLVKNLLETSFSRIRVEGEITGFKRAVSGHSYFALTERDPEGGTLKLDCVIYRFARVAAALDLRDGQRVVATGRVTSYGGTSRYQLSVDAVEEAGIGDLLRRLEELRRRLAAEGLFDQARRRKIPFLPRRIGVVTSLRGAAVRDIVRTILMRFPARILLVDSVVQGDGAAEGVAKGIDLLNLLPDVDVIIIGRGGGSLEDLWAFNQESLVRAVAGSRIPVVSAVGHDVDRVLTDESADARAATPTAAGTLVVPSIAELNISLEDLRSRLSVCLTRRLEVAGQRLDDLETRLRAAGDRLLDPSRQRVVESGLRLSRVVEHVLKDHRHSADLLAARLVASHPARSLGEARRRMGVLAGRIQAQGPLLLNRPRNMLSVESGRMQAIGAHLLLSHRNALDACGLRLLPLSPFAPLDRGYALVRTSGGHLIHRHDQVKPGDHVDVMLGSGAIDCTVDVLHADRVPESAGS